MNPRLASASLTIVVMCVSATASGAPVASRGAPFVLVLSDGSRLEVVEKPERGESTTVKIHLYPAGTLSSVPSSRVDWVATRLANEKAGAPAPASPAPVPTAPMRNISSLAKGLQVESSRAGSNDASLGKMKSSTGKTLEVSGDKSYFGEASVWKHVSIERSYLDFSGCPDSKARVYCEIRNRSRKKLRDLKAWVLVGGTASKQSRDQIVSLSPRDILPDETAELSLQLSCDWATSGDKGVAVLGDVAGRLEEMSARPADAPIFPGKGTPPKASQDPKK